MLAAGRIKSAEVAKRIREGLKAQVQKPKGKHGIVPGLVTVLKSDDPTYRNAVRAKRMTAHEPGFRSLRSERPADIKEADLSILIDEYQKKPKIQEVLIQLPLPKHINEANLLYAIDPDKDVDGFHPVNVGKLMTGAAVFPPHTPAGNQEPPVLVGAPVKDSVTVVAGRSNIVGKTVPNMQVQKGPGANAAVSLERNCTKGAAVRTKRADIPIVAAGAAEYVTDDMVKEEAVVIATGVNETGRTGDGKHPSAGDVDFDSVAERASAITPFLGGVGPMTVTCS